MGNLALSLAWAGAHDASVGVIQSSCTLKGTSVVMLFGVLAKYLTTPPNQVVNHVVHATTIAAYALEVGSILGHFAVPPYSAYPAIGAVLGRSFASLFAQGRMPDNENMTEDEDSLVGPRRMLLAHIQKYSDLHQSLMAAGEGD